MATWRQLMPDRRHGALEAQRTRVDFGLVDEQRLDIFELIDRAGIWLMFQPLDRLYGFYRHVGDTAGIAINANHPRMLQRYTAAHEFAHHVLGHSYSLDEVSNIDGARGVPEAADLERTLTTQSRSELGNPHHEAAAQAFAATLLMPLHIVNRLLVERGFNRERPDLEPADVYGLSLELGTSYEATVTQFAVLDKITWPKARALRVPPVSIKTKLIGERPADARADVWLVDNTTEARHLHLRTGDEVIIRLPVLPSTGYTWTPVRDQHSSLDVIDDTIKAASDDVDLLGGSATRELHLRAGRSGRDRVELQLRRPWEDNSPPAQSLSLDINVEPSPTGDASSGLVYDQQVRRASAGAR